MRNQFRYNIVYAREPGHWTVGQPRQLPAVTARQMPAGHLNLLFDQVEIIEQPFGGVRDTADLIDRMRGAVIGAQHLLVVLKTREETVRSLGGDHLMTRGQTFRVPGQLLEIK